MFIKNNTLFFHILEIRYRIFYLLLSFIITFLICYIYSFDLLFLTVQPFIAPKFFIFTDLTEALSTTIQICLIISLHLITPLLLYHFWTFLIPGFFLYERIRISYFFFYFFSLLIFEIFLIFFLIIPEIMSFLFTFEIKKEIMTIQLEARIYSYIHFLFNIYWAVLCSFQIPFVFLFLCKNRIINTKSLCFYRKYFYFLALLLAAFLSPPDMFYQLCLAFFFIIVYELSVWLSFIYKNLY